MATALVRIKPIRMVKHIWKFHWNINANRRWRHRNTSKRSFANEHGNMMNTIRTKCSATMEVSMNTQIREWTITIYYRRVQHRHRQDRINFIKRQSFDRKEKIGDGVMSNVEKCTKMIRQWSKTELSAFTFVTSLLIDVSWKMLLFIYFKKKLWKRKRKYTKQTLPHFYFKTIKMVKKRNYDV